jgi:hypothetical protein
MSKRPVYTESDNWQLNWEPNEVWKALQLSDEQKAQLRSRMEAKIARARADGVYERFATLRGKVEFSLQYHELRSDE